MPPGGGGGRLLGFARIIVGREVLDLPAVVGGAPRGGLLLVRATSSSSEIASNGYRNCLNRISPIDATVP
jgi:hypothetical protein